MKGSRFLSPISLGALIALALVGLFLMRWTRMGAFLMGIFIIHSIFSAPISFYGKVQDQFGKPVPGATVKYEVVDKFWANGSKYTGYSDAQGLFSISGIGGAGMLVGAMKDGYDSMRGKSSQNFGYGMGVDDTRKAPPTKDAPAVFILRKMAPADSVIFIGRHQYTLNHDGTPISINLLTGKAGRMEASSLQVSCWTNEESKDANRHFDWTCDITVPGGGLVERTDENLFVAPEDGYTPSSHAWFDRDGLTHRWSTVFEKQYFVRLADGRYGRISLDVYVGGWSFVGLESVLNPKPGERNLEYDPKVAVNIP